MVGWRVAPFAGFTVSGELELVVSAPVVVEVSEVAPVRAFEALSFLVLCGPWSAIAPSIGCALDAAGCWAL